MSMMQRASIKRSFNCEDLSSIDDGLDSHLTRAMEAQESCHEENYYSRKRRKATSLDSSSWTTSIKSIPLQPPSVAASVSNDSITPKTTSTLVAVASTTPSHVATATAITPDQEEVISPSSSDEVGSLPYFPSLRRNRSVSCDFPATAALEQIMLKHRRSPTNVMGNDSTHSLEEREVQWPRFQEEEEDTKDFLPSPRRKVENSPTLAYMRRVSLSMPSSTTSSSSTLLHNNPNSIKSRSPPTVNQITEALETLARI